jgi:hypothetical protein
MERKIPVRLPASPSSSASKVGNRVSLGRLAFKHLGAFGELTAGKSVLLLKI